MRLAFYKKFVGLQVLFACQFPYKKQMHEKSANFTVFLILQKAHDIARYRAPGITKSCRPKSSISFFVALEKAKLKSTNFTVFLILQKRTTSRDIVRLAVQKAVGLQVQFVVLP